MTMLTEVLHRAGVTAEFGPCPAADLRTAARDLPLSPELVNLYATFGPLDPVHIPAPLGGITLVPARDLVSRQSCYRWHGTGGHRLEGWPDAWVVITDHSGDPFIADTAAPGTRVGIAVHGTGSWRPFWVAPTPADFLVLLACLTQAYAVEHLGRSGEAEGDDDESWPPGSPSSWPTMRRESMPRHSCTT
ncbi:hypothetical protein GCM10009665_11470 [Kitasatospora nipponensis]|uniref:SUKH superfamily protein n=2 Tax=Kitasatospora nipponensis TaxID=258049 RepID=A0ABN1VTQ0_9ACTN